jgi:AcrR family transcriptional regulator
MNELLVTDPRVRNRTMPRPADPNAREALLVAARAEFVKKGLLGARIEDITSAVGLSKGAFYLHFPSKDAAFAEWVERLRADLDVFGVLRVDRFDAFTAKYGQLSQRDRVRQTARYHALLELEIGMDREQLEQLWNHRETLVVIVRGCGGTPFENLLWVILDNELERVKGHYLHRQACLGARNDVSPDLVASMIVGTFFLVTQRMILSDQKPNLDEIARSLHQLICDGLHPQTLPSRAAMPRAASVSRATASASGASRPSRPSRTAPRKTAANSASASSRRKR